MAALIKPVLSKTLVVGATGATGKHVVLQLLQQKQHVHAIARSKQRLLDSLDEIAPNSSSEFSDHLEVTEAAVLDLSADDMKKATKGCGAVVSCLGHNLTFQGVYGKPRSLVTDATKRLCEAIDANHSEISGESKTKDSKTKFILMGTVAVSNPAGGDDKRSLGERIVLFLLRYLLPPQRDNECAVDYIFTRVESSHLEWTVVRPTSLVDGSSSKYELFEKPKDSLFGGDDVCTRANVAKFMVDMILTDNLWDSWKFKFPVIYDMN
jgi:putative NADH-flavin reductase